MHTPSVPIERLSSGIAKAISPLRQFGRRIWGATKAAYAVVCGSDQVDRRKLQAAAWDAAIDSAAYDCEQAARGYRLKAAGDDAHDPFNMAADQLTRHAAKIRLLKTETIRGRKFFEQAEEAAVLDRTRVRDR